MKIRSPNGREFWIGHTTEHGILIRDDGIYQPDPNETLLWRVNTEDMHPFDKQGLETSVQSYNSLLAGKTPHQQKQLHEDLIGAIHVYEGWLTNGRYSEPRYQNVCWKCNQTVGDGFGKRCHRCRMFKCDQGDCYCTAPEDVRDRIDRALAASHPPPDAISYIRRTDGLDPLGS